MKTAHFLAKSTSLWILTDGKPGDENQCLGIAQNLGLEPQIYHVCPRAPWVWLMPWGPPDPKQTPAPPYPDILIASGRRAIPYIRQIKRVSGGKTFTTCLKDPRTGAKTADFIWTPSHDALRGDNVMTTLTSPHIISQDKLEAAKTHHFHRLPSPKVGVLIGGATHQATWTSQDITRLKTDLKKLAASGVTLLGTFSRRTTQEMREALSPLFTPPHWLWDGTGDNPYIPLLANTDALIVTADSVNMIGEATATGHPVLVFRPHRISAKIKGFLHGLEQLGAIRNFTGPLERFTYPPQDSTPEIARELARRYAEFRTRIK